MTASAAETPVPVLPYVSVTETVNTQSDVRPVADAV